MIRALVVSLIGLLLVGTRTAGASDGGVLVEICDRGIPAEKKWPVGPFEFNESYHETAFGFFRTPWRYIDTGIREDRHVPFLYRASATMTLPLGKVRLLLRARGPARLFVDEKIVVDLPFPKISESGHGTLRTQVLTLGNTRFLAAGDEEKLIDFDSPGGVHRVVLETIVGSIRAKKPLKPELGETLVAIAPGASDAFTLLSPTETIPLTDEAWTAYAASRDAEFDRLERSRRAAARASHDAEIASRHDAARQWVKLHPEPEIPGGARPDANPIDRFLDDKLSRARSAATKETGSVHFYESVRPLLADRCLTCHSNKAKGGLRLDSLAAATKGGKSGKPAIAPGEPQHSQLLARVRSSDPDELMPPRGERLTTQEIALIEKWIREGAIWPEEEPAADITAAPLADDLTFARRLYLDVVGVPPTSSEILAFVKDSAGDKRKRLIETLLDDPRWADVWTGLWQDWLAENPSLVNGTLNNTGPFRWFLYESFLDRKPMDVFVTELVMMNGSVYGGGPAGFGVAGQNDAPLVAKAGALAATFLATNMKCARCHDAPFHSSTQADLFHLAAMLSRAPVSVPKSSVVPMDHLTAGGRIPLIKVTLKPGEAVAPMWSLTSIVPEQSVDRSAADSRAVLGNIITAPQNQRFAEVMVNRIWSHYFGRGLVNPLSDWENAQPSHPALLHWLAREFVAHDYSVQHIARLILTSNAYLRQTSANQKAIRFYAAMPKRRMSAEQIVDTLFGGFGVPLQVETLCIDLDASRTPDNGVNLGKPRRAWQFVYLSNDRDRPSLSLPRAQVVGELMTAFGWNGNRQDVLSERNQDPNVLQSALLQNGAISRWLTRLSDRSAMTKLSLEASSPDELVRQVFVRLLTREPEKDELARFTSLLKPGFGTRIKTMSLTESTPHTYTPYVAWSNHLSPEATVQREKEAADARAGSPPTKRLDDDWRQRMEDFLWTVLNAPELEYVP